jgi:hypothetical protein
VQLNTALEFLPAANKPLAAGFLCCQRLGIHTDTHTHGAGHSDFAQVNTFA